MNWLDKHLGSIGYVADFYIPESGVGGTGEKNRVKKQVGTEQLRILDTKWEPRVVKNIEYDFPRLQKFYDWEHFLDWIDWRGRESLRSSHDTCPMYQDFSKTEDFRSAMDLARYGWIEGLKEIEELKSQNLELEPVRKSYDVDTKYDVAGGSVHVGRYLNNAPDCMRAMHFSAQHMLPTRTIKIIVATYIDRTMKAQTVIKNGYKIYQFIEMLEMQNIRTEIVLASWINKMYMSDKNDYDVYETYIKLKNTEDTFYPEKLLFALAHPAMYRRLIISERERNPQAIRKKFGFYSGGHYGLAIDSWSPPSNMTTGSLVLKSITLPELPVLLEQAKKLTKVR